MKLFMPKQHGAWAMLVVPFGLGIVAGGFHWSQILLGLGWVPLYLSTYPLLLAVKKVKVSFHMSWFYKYFAVAMIFILPVLIVEPWIFYVGLSMLPFFLLNLYFGSRKKDRHFWNDISAIVAFSFSSFATYYLGAGKIDSLAWVIWGISILFFVGSTFYVKSMIRERKNISFRRLSWTYHFVIFLFLMITGEWILVLAFVPSLVRIIYSAGKTMRPMKMGIIEIVNSVLFFIAISIYLV